MGKNRRDEIDASHFPAFHQMEGVKLFDPALVGGAMSREEWLASEGCALVAADLKKTLEGLCDHLFGPVEKRWVDEYFPFTEPSAEFDISREDGSWLELGGCGMVHPKVLRNCGIDPEEWQGFAFGFGIDRLAVMRYELDDIRELVNNDVRFLRQF